MEEIRNAPQREGSSIFSSGANLSDLPVSAAEWRGIGQTSGALNNDVYATLTLTWAERRWRGIRGGRERLAKGEGRFGKMRRSSGSDRSGTIFGGNFEVALEKHIHRSRENKQ